MVGRLGVRVRWRGRGAYYSGGGGGGGYHAGGGDTMGGGGGHGARDHIYAPTQRERGGVSRRCPCFAAPCPEPIKKYINKYR